MLPVLPDKRNLPAGKCRPKTCVLKQTVCGEAWHIISQLSSQHGVHNAYVGFGSRHRGHRGGHRGLANAIAAVDAGGEVLVANAVPGTPAPSIAPAVPETPAALTGLSPIALRERVATARGWLRRDTLDLETNEYLAAVGEDITDSAIDRGNGAVPRRNARNLSTEEAFRRPVETFVGARLTGWAEQCVASLRPALRACAIGAPPP